MEKIDFRHDLLPLKDRLFRTALRITLNRQEAEDITQDVLLRVWEQRDRLVGVRSLEAFVLTMGRNMALDHLRAAESANVSLDDVDTDAPDAAPRPDEALERSERMQRIHDIVSRLPEAQRTALQLRDVEGHTYAETAAIMGITEDNVKVTLHRARRAVRAQYEKGEKS